MTPEKLAHILKAAADAHHEHEVSTGEKDEKWPEWYAKWILAHHAADVISTPEIDQAQDELSDLLEDDEAGNDEVRDAAVRLCEVLNAARVQKSTPFYGDRVIASREAFGAVIGDEDEEETEQ